MFNLSKTNKYNIFTQGVDMRKGVESLCGIVRTSHMNPLNGDVYVFPINHAIATYEQFPHLNAFKEKDLLRAHGIMMQALVDNAGHYRRGNVGVFSKTGCVHIAPPADRVPLLMGDLFDWLNHSKDHLLVRSCVFHYEFEFIHPFADGNGRMGRLWQSLILTKLHPVFEHLPVENMVHDNQQKYYDAITASTNGADSGPFIDFMLGEILKTLELHKGELIQSVPDKVPNIVPYKIPNKVPNKLIESYSDVTASAWNVYTLIKQDSRMTIAQMAEALSVSDRMIKKYLTVLKENGLVARIGSNKTGYWQITKI